MSAALGQSWGRYPRVQQRIVPVLDRNAQLPLPSDGGTVLPHGNGRSYGDSCLNPAATLLTSRALDRFIDFDPSTGVVRCESRRDPGRYPGYRPAARLVSGGHPGHPLCHRGRWDRQ